ncbi:C-C motif chemokine 14 [Nannospalax galili]|uniref:C-C motif chemokine 14 n=1 Tax=Nannospalax galili TaxID=1026970 RepID=UPI0004ED12B5|nr:C-C motif chemokine 14 [Nannospalax galili]
MKVSVATISFLLIAFTIEAKATSSSGGPYHPSECCFTYVTHPVPHDRILDYYKTSSECPKPGIVLITKKGRSICAKPRDEWVQEYIKDLKEN